MNLQLQPANAQSTPADAPEFVQLSCRIESYSQRRLQLRALYRLLNDSKLARFEDFHCRAKLLTLYAAVGEEDLQLNLNGAFNNFPRQPYCVFTQFPASRYALECRVALYQVMTTDNQRCCESPPPCGFDSYCLVGKGMFVLQGGRIQLNDGRMREHPLQYYVWGRSNFIPTRFVVLRSASGVQGDDGDDGGDGGKDSALFTKSTIGSSKQQQKPQIRLCDICLQCAERRITPAEYFNQENEAKSQHIGACNPAELFCQQDGVYLCGYCDEQLHRVELLRKHDRKPVFKALCTVCLEHGLEMQFFDSQTLRCYCAKCAKPDKAVELKDIELQDQRLARQLAPTMQLLQLSAEKIQQDTAAAEAVLVRSFQTCLQQLQKSGQFAMQQVFAQILELLRMQEETAALEGDVQNCGLALDRRIAAQAVLTRIKAEQRDWHERAAEVSSTFLNNHEAAFKGQLSNIQFAAQVNNDNLKQIAALQQQTRILGLLGSLDFQKPFAIADVQAATEQKEAAAFDLDIFTPALQQPPQNAQPLGAASSQRQQQQQQQQKPLISLAQVNAWALQNPGLGQSKQIYNAISEKQSAQMPEPHKSRRHRQSQASAAPSQQTSKFQAELERLREEQKPKSLTEYYERMVDAAEEDFALTNVQQLQRFSAAANPLASVKLEQTHKLSETKKDANLLDYVEFQPISPSVQFLAQPLFGYNDDAAAAGIPALSFTAKASQLDKMYKISQSRAADRFETLPFAALRDRDRQFKLLVLAAHCLRLENGAKKLKIALPKTCKCSTVSQIFAAAENAPLILICQTTDKIYAVFVPKVSRVDGRQKRAFVVDFASESYSTDLSVSVHAACLQVGEFSLAGDLHSAVVDGQQQCVMECEVDVF